MLMMFGVGLHFSIQDLPAVRGVAIPGAVVQIVGATVSGAAMALWWGWSLGGALVFGLSLSVACWSSPSLTRPEFGRWSKRREP